MAPDIPEGSLAGPERYNGGGLHSTAKGHLDGLQGKHKAGVGGEGCDPRRLPRSQARGWTA